jgi:hypothetical protein
MRIEGDSGKGFEVRIGPYARALISRIRILFEVWKELLGNGKRNWRSLAAK